VADTDRSADKRWVPYGSQKWLNENKKP